MSVFKLRRPKAQWSNPEVPEFYDTYYLKIRGADGRQILRNTNATDKALAERLEAAAKRKIKAEGWQAMMDALEPVKGRATLCTFKQLFEAYEAEGVKVLKNAMYVQRNINAMRRVVATALDAWTIHTGGIQGKKIGAQVADWTRIGAMSTGILTAELREKYFQKAQGGTLDWSEPQEGNTTINSTLAMATDLFSKDATYHKLKTLQLPGTLDGFRKGPWLPEEDSRPEPLDGKQFTAMLKGAEELRRTRPALALVNAVLRQTGLRSAYVVAIHASWLVKVGGRWHLEIRNRTEPKFRKKPGTRDQMIPLTRMVAAALLANRRKGDYLILPGGTEKQREELVRMQHNEWVKTIIGGTGERTQGNHRLRDTVGSILWSIDKPTAAQEALGHSSVDTTAKHYAKRIDVTALMRREMGAWLQEERQPENVIRMA